VVTSRSLLCRGGIIVPTALPRRTEFALAPNNGALRIYAGDAGSGAADFYRVDNALVPASYSYRRNGNPAGSNSPNPARGTPVSAHTIFCGGQLVLMICLSPRRQATPIRMDRRQMQYGEIFFTRTPSNGRTIQRSTDAGVSFTDMTNDTQSPPLGMHPDQHAIVFVSWASRHCYHRVRWRGSPYQCAFADGFQRLRTLAASSTPNSRNANSG